MPVDKKQLKDDLKKVVAGLKDDESIGVKGAVAKLGAMDVYKGVDLMAQKADVKELLIEISKEQDGSSSSSSSSSSSKSGSGSDSDDDSDSLVTDESGGGSEDDDPVTDDSESESGSGGDNKKKRKRKRDEEADNLLKMLAGDGITAGGTGERASKRKAFAAMKRMN